jgi:hypothetical protein
LLDCSEFGNFLIIFEMNMFNPDLLKSLSENCIGNNISDTNNVR